jgi:hypothetical protein
LDSRVKELTLGNEELYGQAAGLEETRRREAQQRGEVEVELRRGKE